MKDLGMVIMLNAIFWRVIIGEADTVAEDVLVWVVIFIMAIGASCYMYGSATEAQP